MLAIRLQGEASAANRATPVFMGHGEVDQVVPVAFARRSAGKLEEMGYAVTLRTYLMPHSVVDEELRDVREFLAAALR
jgi:phospholipase/carboxylesterase